MVIAAPSPGVGPFKAMGNGLDQKFTDVFTAGFNRCNMDILPGNWIYHYLSIGFYLLSLSHWEWLHYIRP